MQEVTASVWDFPDAMRAIVGAVRDDLVSMWDVQLQSGITEPLHGLLLAL